MDFHDLPRVLGEIWEVGRTPTPNFRGGAGQAGPSPGDGHGSREVLAVQAGPRCEPPGGESRGTEIATRSRVPNYLDNKIDDR